MDYQTPSEKVRFWQKCRASESLFSGELTDLPGFSLTLQTETISEQLMGECFPSAKEALTE